MQKHNSVIQIFSRIMLLLLFFSFGLFSAPKGKIPDRNFILENIKPDAGLDKVLHFYHSGKNAEALELLLDELKTRSADRYYLDWRNFESLLKDYDKTYPEAFQQHRRQADYHTSHYAPETEWDLPSVNLLGNQVTPYELRHLARQQKSLDMTLLYFQDDREDYLDYWVRQVADLMEAYKKGEYEDAGNGIFEYYRAGRRIHSWMFNHHVYYASVSYDKDAQEILLKTFIYHAFDLAERTHKYHPGNHHTKGLVGLFEMAMFLQDFSFADSFADQAVRLLTEHMKQEINDDGFQFERSVHYHVGDIENYLRVYQLAQINHYDLPELFLQRFEGLFGTLMLLAQPDLNLPVLQDDTDHFLQEYNDVRGVFKVGGLLFADPQLNYMAGDKLPRNWYWLLSRQIEVGEVEIETPILGSTALETTGYYIMRNGWDKDDAYMSISAGVDDIKPDHQHGDILGLTAYARGYQILPTYQVKYNRPDYELFKNSWVKNVAIVDSIPHGLAYKGNRGGSGFGKFKDLPKPQTILWESGEHVDIFVGTHDRYTNIGVETYRSVIFLKKLDKWIVLDHFVSDDKHAYQQIWQGLENADNEATLSREFDNKVDMQIIQHSDADYKVAMTKYRDKRSWMVTSRTEKFQFITQISLSNKSTLRWNKNKNISSKDGTVLDIAKKKTLVFGAQELKIGALKLSADKKMDLYLEKAVKGKYTIKSISPYPVNINGKIYEPGQIIR